MMNPEPSEATRASGAPGAPFSPRNSRNTSSSVRPGEFCAVSCAGGVARAVAWVDTLTTLPTRREVNCAKSSAKGERRSRAGMQSYRIEGGKLAETWIALLPLDSTWPDATAQERWTVKRPA